MLSQETVLSLSEAARLLPTRPHGSTLWRWARKGVKSRAGRRIRLEHIRIGHRVFTSIEALDRFVSAVADADVEHFELQTERSPVKLDRRSLAQKQRDMAEAEAELATEGI